MIKTKSTLHNLFWSFLTQGGVEVVRFLSAIVLSRLLLPSDYGLFAIVGIFSGFSTVFIQFTFSPVIVQNRDLNQKDYYSIFWLNLGTGILIGTLFALSGAFLSRFYEQPILEFLAYLSSFQIVIGSMTVVQRSLQEKEHNFKNIGLIRFTSTVLAAIVSIILAFRGAGVWALATNMFLLVLFEGIGLTLLSRWIPRFFYSKSTLKKIFKMTKALFFERITGHMIESLDKFVLGKFGNVGNLGLYSRSYGFLLFPLRNISQVVSQVMLPKVSENVSDKKTIILLYENAVNTVLFLVFPIMSFVFIVPDSIVFTIFGDNWLGMVPYLKILAVCGILSSIIVLTQSLFVGYGASRTMNKITFFEKPIFVVFILLGFYSYESIGLTFGLLFSSILSVLIRQYQILQILGLSFFRQNKLLINCTVLTFAISSLYSLMVPHNSNHYVVFSFFTIILLFYYGLSFKLKIGFAGSLKNLNTI